MSYSDADFPVNNVKHWVHQVEKKVAWEGERLLHIHYQTSLSKDFKNNKTKSLKSRERGELKSKRWMMIKVDWWLKSIDDYLKLIDEIVLRTN